MFQQKNLLSTAASLRSWWFNTTTLSDSSFAVEAKLRSFDPNFYGCCYIIQYCNIRSLTCWSNGYHCTLQSTWPWSLRRCFFWAYRSWLLNHSTITPSSWRNPNTGERSCRKLTPRWVLSFSKLKLVHWKKTVLLRWIKHHLPKATKNRTSYSRLVTSIHTSKSKVPETLTTWKENWHSFSQRLQPQVQVSPMQQIQRSYRKLGKLRVNVNTEVPIASHLRRQLCNARDANEAEYDKKKLCTHVKFPWTRQIPEVNHSFSWRTCIGREENKV